MVEEIREASKGLTCGSCDHARLIFPGGTGYCSKFTDEFSGEFIRVSEKAPACKRHPEVINIENRLRLREDCSSGSGEPSEEQ